MVGLKFVKKSNEPRRGILKSEVPGYNITDPNPIIFAHAIFPQSGCINLDKRSFFLNFPHFSNLEPNKNEEPLMVKYVNLKPMKILITCKRNLVVSINR